MMNNWLLNIRPKPQNKPYITLAYFGRILMPNHWKTMVAWHEIQCLSYLAKSFTKSNDSILTNYVKWLNGTWPHPLSVKLHLRDKRTKRHGHSDKRTDTMAYLSPQSNWSKHSPSHFPPRFPIHLPSPTPSTFPFLHSLVFPPLTFPSTPSLKLGPLNPARRRGASLLSSPSGSAGSSPSCNQIWCILAFKCDI